MKTEVATETKVILRRPHKYQNLFLESPAKRKVLRAGRRSGKTTGAAISAVLSFLKGQRILYAVPTADQLGSFWWEVKRALQEPLDAGVFYKNETDHVIELPRTQQRIRAKTCWDADTLRGDSAALLIIDEWQLCNEEMWNRVGAPMLLDNDGDALFIYTPPSLRSRSVSKARDPLHAAKMFKAAQADTTGRWAAFTWRSMDNPYISESALAEIVGDMTVLAHRQEILAEDIEEMPGALWRYSMFQHEEPPDARRLMRVVVAIDPAGKSEATSDETGIVVAAKGRDERYYVLADASGRYSPDGWGRRAVALYQDWGADRIIGETNNGGEMVEHVIATVDRTVAYKGVHASRGKQVRAEPIAAIYEQGKTVHCGRFDALEEQLCSWTPESRTSPDRMDACVWALTELSGRGYSGGMKAAVGGQKASLTERLGW